MEIVRNDKFKNTNIGKSEENKKTELSYSFGIQKNELKTSDYYSELIQEEPSGTFRYVSILHCRKWSLMKTLTYDLKEDLSININVSEKKDTSVLVKEITDLVSEMMNKALSSLS